MTLQLCLMVPALALLLALSFAPMCRKHEACLTPEACRPAAPPPTIAVGEGEGEE